MFVSSLKKPAARDNIMTDTPKPDDEVDNTTAQPEPVAAQPEPVAAQPEPVAAQPEPVAAQPEPVAAQPEPVAAQPEPVAAQPEPVAAQPEPVAAKPEPVAAKPEPVAAKPEPVAAKPEPVAAKPEPEPVAAKPEPVAAKPEPAPQKLDIVTFIREEPPIPSSVERGRLKAVTRRDFLIYSVGAVAAASGLWWLLPSDTQTAHLTMAQQTWLDSLETRISPKLATQSGAVKAKFLNRVLTFDDDVSAALLSTDRSVPTYTTDMITPNLRNNYDGQTPDPSYIDTWNLQLSGLASGKTEKLPIALLKSRFTRHDQITRLVCVEGWSAIAGWGGFRFADLLTAYPPMPNAKWAKLISDVNLDSDGNSDPYYVSIDLKTATHPQALLATHHDGKPLEVEHGAPLRLIVPMKLGLKNIKAVTRIEYSVEQPADYWNDRGYSKYDGL
jgi:DMSO/TMAO reductase YedYZ molybdopterin-dependent catalytic subunit